MLQCQAISEGIHLSGQSHMTLGNITKAERRGLEATTMQDSMIQNLQDNLSARSKGGDFSASAMRKH